MKNQTDKTNEGATDLAINQPTSVAANKPHTRYFTDEQIEAAAINNDANLPSLTSSQTAQVPLSIAYWSAETEGEKKRGWILGIGMQEVADMETGELKELESLFFVEDAEDGKKIRYFTSSIVLVANVKTAISRGEIIPNSLLTPVQITYLGTKKNSRNAFKSKQWEILPLVVKN